MFLHTKQKADCCGCGACQNVCPKKCIEMVKDEEGFLYPQITEACIHCGKCEKVCPMAAPKINQSSYEQKAFAALSKDHDIWQSSSSGGAFTELCRAWDDGSTLFVGAAWSDLEVKHCCITDIKKIAPLRKSKYVSSNIGFVYQEIKNWLDNGKRCVFCGTPCQVAALKSCLGKEYDNLLLIDFVCHGVGSITVFQACLKRLEKQLGMKIDSFQFRAKEKVYYRDHLTRVTGGRKSLLVRNDPFTQLFLSQSCLRPSCVHNCPFRDEKRIGDITIADFKKLTDVFPHLLGEKKNYSSIIINTVKGESTLENLRKEMKIYECSIDDIKKYNPVFYGTPEKANKRDAFFVSFCENADAAVEQYTNEVIIVKKTRKQVLFELLPVFMRRNLLNWRHSCNEER